MSDLVVPLAVRSFDISVADGHRGVFFKLSRVPSGVSHYISRQEQEPARIIVEVQGPAVGEDIPEQAYPGVDALVSEIRMSRTDGQLRLVVELSVDRPPPFSVHQMSDWLTVRFITEK